jgi:actin cytoskeleton-regulatory complex protein PAN1
LINTESSYVRDLQLIVGVFYANILSLLDEKAITVVFANVEDILLTNTVCCHSFEPSLFLSILQAFLSQLEERQKECRLYIDNIGDLLEKHIGAMGVYMVRSPLSQRHMTYPSHSNIASTNQTQLKYCNHCGTTNRI